MSRVVCIDTPCAHCGKKEGVELESSRTAYPQKEGEPDPNAPVPLCRHCAESHHEYWNEMWALAKPEL